ncbi:MAG TPA: BNR repeat-containing protein, partial [Polyangiaceae bacterium]
MALDSEDCLHLSGNMHNAPLVYYRMERPFDISSLQVVPYMTGLNESSCTYPDFFTGPLGELVFMYRFGSSGSGNQIFNSYDTETKIWTRLLGQPLLDGEGANNAYLVSPVQGPDGYFHITWVWRATPNAETNHDVGYARSRDLVNWENGLGQPLTIPIKLSSPATVDPVPQYGGVINNNTKIGFDAEGRAVVVYHKYDSQGNTQLYNARVENGAWVRHQTTNWSYRWNFSGGGTLVFEVEIEPIQVHPNGQITQRFYRIDRGWGAYLIDPVTLTAIEEIDPPLPYPRHLDVPESTTPGMHVRWAFDSGSGDDPDVRYMLRWESLDSNRDMPRETIPPPTQLRLYAIKSSALALAPE